MNLRQLEIFKTVVETQSFSRSAETLSIKQPSVSMSINQLEKDLEVKLFNRTTKRVTPTEAGLLLYDRAKDIIEICKKTQNEVYEIANDKDLSNIKRSLIINSSPLIASYFLPTNLAAFQKKYPHVDITVNSQDEEQLVKRLLNHELDFALLSDLHKNKNLNYRALYQDHLILIANKRIQTKDINQLLTTNNFIDREIGNCSRKIYDQYLEEIGIKRKDLSIKNKFNDTGSIIQAVINGLGMAFVSELAAKFYLEQNLIYAHHKIRINAECIFVVKSKKQELSTVTQLFINQLAQSNNQMGE